jgi:hypothetical protein
MNTPFDTIESAQEFLALLREAVNDANANAHSDILAEADSRSTRRLDAVRLVLYKLEKLEQHLKASGRLLNDLRTLRRLLLDERAEREAERETEDERNERNERSETAAVAHGVKSRLSSRNPGIEVVVSPSESPSLQRTSNKLTKSA